MKWVNILHIYQPPTQTKEIVDLVSRESYQKIVALLDEYPKLRLTINITGSLLVLLKEYGHQDVIDGLARHAKRGAVEFMASAMYHPILPLLSASEIRRQIELHNATAREFFGDSYEPSGFYFPEMAYSADVAAVIASMGYTWTVLDEIHATEPVDPNAHYVIKGIGGDGIGIAEKRMQKLSVIFRTKKYAKTFPPEAIVRDLEDQKNPSEKNTTIVTCHDGELYGHWHKEDWGYYQKAFTDPEIEMMTASDFFAELSRNGEKTKEIAVRDASWESTPDELAHDIPLGLWSDPHNEVHKMLEDLKRNVLHSVESHQTDPGYAEARYHADRGVASCAWWWASERKLGDFSPHTWNPTEIEKGAKELLAAARSLQTLDAAERAAIDDQFASLHAHIWDKHKKVYDPNY